MRRRVLTSFFLVTSCLVWQIAPAQGNGHFGTGAATRGNGATDTRAASSRPATDIERAVDELRKAQTIAAAAYSARAVYDIGAEGRRALLDVCREKTLPEATFQGIVGAFEVSRDQSILPVLIDAFGAGDAARDRYLTERFRTFDAQRSMFDDLFSSLDSSPAPRRRTLLRVLAKIADTPAERMQAAKFLIAAFQRPEFRGHADDLKVTLKEITFHDYPLPALWEKWFDGFAALHPEGFSEAHLYASALRDGRQRFVAEVKRSISIAVGNKQVPGDCFDQVRYPEAAIRAHAATEFATLREAEPAIVKLAATILVDALKIERDEDVTAAILRSLGALAENNEDLKTDVGPRLLPYLKDERDAIVIGALKAITQTGTGFDRRVIEDLYSEAAMSKRDRSAVRAQVVTTLYSLDCTSPTIITALEDTSAEVRANAARGLGYCKRADAAPLIAKALGVEKNEEAQRTMAHALVALQLYPPAVVDVLFEVASKPGIARVAAVRGLIQAASGGIRRRHSLREARHASGRGPARARGDRPTSARPCSTSSRPQRGA